jgi:tetratricopeptide (TPR) repeat protein
MESSRFLPLAPTFVVVVVYVRMFGAGFVEYDDDFHLYANPYLNPLSLSSLGKLWAQAYHGLYNPLAYTIWAAVAAFARVPAATLSSLGQPISLDPALFHAANVAFHVANTWLCFLLAHRLTRSRSAALLCSLVFALHPVQVESVAWISELRGLSSACFGLAALNVLVWLRQGRDRAPATSRAWFGVSALLVILATLCKPVAVILPLVALIIERVALGAAWRRSLATAATWALSVLPIAVMTHSAQKIYPEGASLFWQRPFIAGNALAFYLFKIAVPLDLGVEYGRTPQSVLADGAGYVAWVVPAGLLALAYVHRRRHAIAWLGALLFVTFCLPTSGLMPFTFQAHSTVADRYAYLPLFGIGLVVADVVAQARSNLAARVAGAVVVLLAIRAFDQTSHWQDNVSFLEHTLEVNPDVAFAQNNVGNLLFKEKRYDAAIAHYEKALALEPEHVLAQNNLGLALVHEGRLNEAEPHFRKAVELEPHHFKALESLGAVYLQTNRVAEAIKTLQAAVVMAPSEAKAFNDLGVAFMRNEQPADGLDAFQRAVSIEPNNASYRKNLGLALARMGRTDEAAQFLGASP